MKYGVKLTLLGLFQMLGGYKISGRSREITTKSEFMDDPFLAQSSPKLNHSDDSLPPFSVSSPKCSQVYNIFYSSDPISYRIEPLIAPAMASLKPQPLPYTKKGMFATSASQGLTGIGTKMGQSVSGLFSSFSSGIANSLLNRSLGLSGEEVASMNAPQIAVQSSAPSLGAGTNITSGGVITTPTLARSDTAEKKKQLAAEAANADREGNGNRAQVLIDSEMETLYAGFEKSRQNQVSEDNALEEEKGKKLRKEELKIRALNQTGRIDFTIQEYVYPFSFSVPRPESIAWNSYKTYKNLRSLTIPRSLIEFNPLSTFASHLMYWQDEDLAHFVMGQLLSSRRSKASEKQGMEFLAVDVRRDRGKNRYSSANWI